ncbi:hypothetical protein [Limnothrix redekei]|uniref:Uncharacterized protein n=1 Tax=Limnothrix redekei LRLZ20PSL1 TaxID=3112953 RepID=A0ABW7C848_9CYAN
MGLMCGGWLDRAPIAPQLRHPIAIVLSARAAKSRSIEPNRSLILSTASS